MIDACNDIHGVIVPNEEIDGQLDNAEQLNGKVDDAVTINGKINPVKKSVGVVSYAEDIFARVDFDASLFGHLDGEVSIHGEVTIGECEGGIPYKGDYIVTPRTIEQSLATKAKYMLDDVTIKAIPYYETSNENGTTVYIAGDISYG